MKRLAEKPSPLLQTLLTSDTRKIHKLSSVCSTVQISTEMIAWWFGTDRSRYLRWDFLLQKKPRSYIQLTNRWTSVLIFSYHEACKKYSIRNAQFDIPIRNLFSSKYPKSPSARVPHRTYGSFGVNNSKFCIFKTTKTWVAGILSRLSFGRMRTKNLLPVQRHNQRVRAENWQCSRNNNGRQISCAQIARVMTSLSFWRWFLDPVKKLLLKEVIPRNWYYVAPQFYGSW